MISAVNILKDLKTKQYSAIKSLAVLIDPDKAEVKELSTWLSNIPKGTDYIFVGGSQVENGKTDRIVKGLKTLSALPLILFPGNVNQITPHADALLFLSLISGDNPEYLIHQQVKAVKYLEKTSLEIIPTGYILIDGGKTTTVEQMSQTQAIPRTEIRRIADVATAAQYSGKELIYLEAGSGAAYPVSFEIISQVKKAVKLPLIVGGGIRTETQKQMAFKAGANLVVMGNVFEEFLTKHTTLL